jgi:hypothetical protein
MTTENLPPENLDAPKPSAPPADYIPVDLLPAHAMERIEHLLSQEEKDVLDKARIAQRDAKRAAAAKAKEEDAASSKRAKDVVDELVKKDAITPESERPASGGPPVALSVPPLLTASQLPVAEGYTQDMGEIAAEMGMPAQEAQDLLNFVIGGATQTLEGLDTTNREECVTHLKSFYGETAAETIIMGAQAGFQKLPPGVQSWLNQTTDDGQVLGNHPSVLVMLSLWNGGYSKLTPEAAARELAQHRATKEYLAGDRFKLEKVRLLTMIATRGQSEEMPMPAKAEPKRPAPTSWVQVEIEKIRANEDYTSMDSKKRKPLVERMNQLMAQLHQG